jgi:hypothetical protein
MGALRQNVYSNATHYNAHSFDEPAEAGEIVNLQNWVNQARKHWKEFQPNRYNALVKSGKLEAALQDAVERTYREVTELEDQGFDRQDAWEIVRERYLFVPEEGKNPTAYSESYFNRPPLATVLHEAIATGARTMDIPQPPSESRPMTADQRPKSALEKTAARVDLEVRRAPQRDLDDPIVNIFSSAPLDTPMVRHYSERRGLILFLIWIVVSVPLVELGWIGAIAALFMACLLAYIEHIQRERDREARGRQA